MDAGLSTKASQIRALAVMAEALKAVKRAKKEGVDVKPYRKRFNDCARAFDVGDYMGAAAMAERIREEIEGLPDPAQGRQVTS